MKIKTSVRVFILKINVQYIVFSEKENLKNIYERIPQNFKSNFHYGENLRKAQGKG